MTSSIDSKVAPFGQAVDTFVGFLAGDSDSEVEAPGGPVPTLRKLIAEVKNEASERVDAQIGELREGMSSVREVALQVTDEANRSESAAAVSMSTINIQPSKAVGLAVLAEEGVCTVLKGGVDALKRTTTFVKRGGVLVEVLDPVSGSEFDALAGASPAVAPQIYETLDPALNGRAALLDAANRILATLPNPFEITSQAAPYESLDVGASPELWVTDGAGRIIARLADALALEKARAALASLSSTASQVGFYETLDPSTILVLDADKRVLGAAADSDPVARAQIAQVQATLAGAAGSAPTLATRLSRGLTQYGDPVGSTSSRWSLREVPMRLFKRSLGEVAQAVIALCGDSWSQKFDRYVGPLATLLQNEYGFAGIGYYSFAWFGTASGTWTSASQPVGKDLCARAELIAVDEVIGTWTCSYNAVTCPTPSMSKTTSSTPGDYRRFTVPAGHDSCRLFYGPDAGDGVIEVSWDDGATYGATIGLTDPTGGSVLLPGIPSSATIARIRVVSGSVPLAGVDLQSSAPGVRVHKLGGSGSASNQWAVLNSAKWGAAIASLGPHAFSVLLGTNDQGGAMSPSTFAANVGAIFTKLSAVLPAMDRVVVMPAENQRTSNAYPMSAYASAARAYAIESDAAFMELQQSFGSPAAFGAAYAWGSPRPWFASDAIHPVPETGGRVIANDFYNLFTRK